MGTLDDTSSVDTNEFHICRGTEFKVERPVINSSSSHTQSKHSPLQAKEENPYQKVLASQPPFSVSVLVNFHPLNHALRLVLIQLIALILHNVFLRRLLVRVSQTPPTDTSPVVLVSFNIRTPTEIRQP